jgi:hypothetical protein
MLPVCGVGVAHSLIHSFTARWPPQAHVHPPHPLLAPPNPNYHLMPVCDIAGVRGVN